MREKMIYLTSVNLDDAYSGITRKVFSQFACFEKAFDAYLIGYRGSDIEVIHQGEKMVCSSGREHRHYAVLSVACRIAKEQNARRFYIRNFFCDPRVMHTLKTLKTPGSVIAWEIPTYPYDHQPMNSLSMPAKVKNLIQLRIDQFFRGALKRYVDRIVTFSHVSEIFGIPTIVTGNGIDVDKIRPRKPMNDNRALHMCAVAVMRPWHGYDRLIRGIEQYYRHGGKREIFFHVVGDGTVLQSYKTLTAELAMEDHVIFYGAKTKDEIDEIYDQCNLAVESLGWHRSKVPMGTSIKTREYVAKGLPILASSPMDIFPEGWELAYYAPIDDSDIDMDAVIAFFDNLYEKHSPEQLAENIRAIAHQRCDMQAMMRPVVHYLQQGECK